MSRTLYLPIGTPGSGKSFHAYQMVMHGVIPETAIVSPDELREQLTDDRACQDANGPVFKIVDQIMRARYTRGLDIYLDATNLTARDRSRTIQTALDEYYNIEVMLFKLPEETLRKQNAQRAHAVPEQVMDKMLARLNGVDESEFDYPNINLHTITGPYDGIFHKERTAR